MSVEVQYPVEVTGYQVQIRSNEIRIKLEGVEQGQLVSAGSETRTRRVGDIECIRSDEFREAFITRGGWLRIERRLSMASAILDVLRNERPLFLDDNGWLQTTLEPAGEGEED